MFGFLNVYKPRGMTSHDVIDRLRAVTKIRQIGHTGTLDPFAEGVLPVCIGKATRLIEYLADGKAYIATIKFGKSTTTYDLDGEVISESDKKIKETELIDIVQEFKGEIEQIPPMYSAVRLNGKRLYKYALEGKKVEVSPRKVFVEQIKILSFDEVNQTAEIYVKCSKGTYIRVIGNDIGEKLGCGAYLSKLIRVQAGDFEVSDAIKLEDFSSEDDVLNNIIYPLKKLPLKNIDITDEEYEKIIHGMALHTNGDPRWKKINKDEFVILVYNNKLAAIAYLCDDSIKVKKVFL